MLPNTNFEKMYYVSDLHLNHYWTNESGEERGVILFERKQFRTIQEHDDNVWNSLFSWAEKHRGATLWILGDFGDVEQLYRLLELRFSYNITVNFIYGNHDSVSDWEEFEQYCDNVYRYPVYLNDRIVLSHRPIWPTPYGTLNVHGHLHGAELDSPQHITCSINDINYQPIGWKSISKRLSKIPKADTKFLYEPYAEHYKLLMDRPDLVVKKNGMLDVMGSRKKLGR